MDGARSDNRDEYNGGGEGRLRLWRHHAHGFACIVKIFLFVDMETSRLRWRAKVMYYVLKFQKKDHLFFKW